MISPDPKRYAKAVLKGDKRILAKTITLIESSLPAHQESARQVIDLLIDYTGKAVRVGITGVPGAGKSTFIESFGNMLVNNGYRVAVLAVDPSSSKSGGSILADKTRMEKLSVRKNAFIRPSPSGGTLGGVARKTRESMLVCEAAGFDVIIIETMGVGQSETTVYSMVDFFLVLMVAGTGDELQGIKKGILELAHAITINKADGDNIERAEKARKELETALHFLYPSSMNWTPPVLTSSCVGKNPTGLNKIWKIICEYRHKMIESGQLEPNRKKQNVDWMWALIEDGIKDRFFKNSSIQKVLPEVIQEVEKGSINPLTAANKLLFMLDSK